VRGYDLYFDCMIRLHEKRECQASRRHLLESRVQRNMEHKCLVFDFFGVICSEVAPFWLAKYLSADDAIRVKATIVSAADRGELSQEELFSALAEITQVPPVRIEQEWRTYVHINEKIVALIREIAPRYKLGLLTNSPSPFVRRILEEHGLSKLFESIVVSSELGYAKPDRKTYETILSDLSVQAPQALMIDDNADNVAGAIAAGMAGLVFQSYEQLKAKLT
jgi:HAD superfamily hydrolase (TIGR01509 family)